MDRRIISYEFYYDGAALYGEGNPTLKTTMKYIQNLNINSYDIQRLGSRTPLWISSVNDLPILAEHFERLSDNRRQTKLYPGTNAYSKIGMMVMGLDAESQQPRPFETAAPSPSHYDNGSYTQQPRAHPSYQQPSIGTRIDSAASSSSPAPSASRPSRKHVGIDLRECRAPDDLKNYSKISIPKSSDRPMVGEGQGHVLSGSGGMAAFIKGKGKGGLSALSQLEGKYGTPEDASKIGDSDIQVNRPIIEATASDHVDVRSVLRRGGHQK